MTRFAAVLWLAALAPCAGGCAARHGMETLQPDARAALRRERVCWAGREGVYIARGDGSDTSRIVDSAKLGKGGAVFLPSMPRDRDDRLLFLSLLDLDARVTTGTALTLNILDLEGERVAFWRRVSLAKIVAGGPDGRYELFAVPAAAWSHDGERIALALRRAAPAADAVLLMDADGNPTRLIAIDPLRFSRATSIAWMPGNDVLVLGVEGRGDAGEGTLGRLEIGAAVHDGAAVNGGAVREGSPAVRAFGRGAYPAVSPDGASIAVVEAGDQLALLDRDGARINRFELAEGRAVNRPFWSRDGRYLYYYALVPSGPLGLGQVTVLRCLDTRGSALFDLVRLR